MKDTGLFISKKKKKHSVHVYFCPHIIIDENTSSGVLLSCLWHMLSFLSPALAVTNAVASAFLMQVCAACFSSLPVYTTIYLDEFTAGLSDCSPRRLFHTPPSTKWLYLSWVLDSFLFLTSIINCTFTVLLRRYEPTNSCFLINWFNQRFLWFIFQTALSTMITAFCGCFTLDLNMCVKHLMH